ncbi:hypothetical protein, partial [Burkholderia ubonensis]|uniref:hypothetical protein n=1 Tax=Burkholderia ubonensis TaxID=101571 RepID=UPI001E2EB329
MLDALDFAAIDQARGLQRHHDSGHLQVARPVGPANGQLRAAHVFRNRERERVNADLNLTHFPANRRSKTDPPGLLS